MVHGMFLLLEINIYIPVCLTHYTKQIIWLINITTGMEIGEFASYMIPFFFPWRVGSCWQEFHQLCSYVQSG
jgi:hypothetical protein